MGGYWIKPSVDAVRTEVFPQVAVHVFEDDGDFRFAVKEVQQREDVGVLKFFH